MAGPWDTPPSAEEMKQTSGWDAPPTAAELARVAAPQAAGPTPTLGARDTGLFHFARHLTGGLGDKIVAAEGGLSDYLHDKTGKVSLGDAYRNNLAFNDKTVEASDKENPKARWVGNIAGGGLSALALGGASALRGAAAPAGLLPRALEGMRVGGALGAVGGFGNSRADTLGGTLADTAKGGAAGAALGGLLPVAGAGGRALARTLRVQPGANAQELARLGVDTSRMTLGQLNPEGFMAQMETAGEHAMGSGNVIRAQREAGQHAWQEAVLNRAQPPYQPMPTGAPAEVLGAAYQGFSPAYGAIREAPIPTSSPGQLGEQARAAFTAVAEDANTLASDAERHAVGRFLQNEASRLGGTPGHQPTVGELMQLRSNLRRELAGQTQTASPSRGTVQMLRSAEDAVSGLIENNLSPAERAALQGIDAQYAQHKVVEGAVRRAGDQLEGFRPTHLSAAVKAATDPGGYARGAGGDLRELAQTGRVALETRTPPTGARALMQLVPGSHYVQAPIAALANTPGMKRLLLGQVGAPNLTPAVLPGAADTLSEWLAAHPQALGAATAEGDSMEKQRARALALRSSP